MFRTTTARAIGRRFESMGAEAAEFWNRRGFLNAALLPLGGLFFAAAGLRRALWRCGVFRAQKISVPVIVVGNIVAGGGGKTPLVAALAAQLQKSGMSPGVVSRGFGGGGKLTMVENESDWRQCGDEPLMLRRKTGLPVCVGADRPAAARMLAENGCDVIVSDDGLQHFALARDVEICARHADYQNGNGWPLPAGPLREPAARADECDFVAVVGGQDSPPRVFGVELQVDGFYASDDPESRFSADELRAAKTAAFAGIARPARFFRQLEKMGIHPEVKISLPDHGRMSDAKLRDIQAERILTTEKDAVKYGGRRRLLALEVHAILPPLFVSAILKKLEMLND